MTIRIQHAILAVVLRFSPTLVLIACLSALGCASEGATPTQGTWRGDDVAFHLEGGELSDWWLQKMYCDAQAAESPTGQSCLAFPQPPFEPTSVSSGRFTLRSGILTLRGTFEDEVSVSGTWKVDDPNCCQASGAWSASLFEALPEPEPTPDASSQPSPADADEGQAGPGVTPSGAAPQSPNEVCARWQSDTADLNEGMWSGNTVSCDWGALSDKGVTNTLKAVNLFRALAGLAPVTTRADYNDLAQACSLMMQANQTISHTPDNAWTCFTEQGAKGAGESNLATAPSVSAVFLYMGDMGNETTMGHRRWILQNGLGPIGVGSAPDYSCLHLLGSEAVDTQIAWTAWPPPGYLPFEAVSTLTPVGWTFHAHSVDITEASVTVTREGEALKLTQWPLAGGFGGSEALAFAPDGWTVTPGVYDVAISSTPPVSYSVNVVSCGR